MEGDRSMSKTSIEVVAILDKHVQERHLLTHPFYQAWSAGAPSLRALQEYSQQYYRHVEAFPTYVSAVHANCPALPIRQHLLENLFRVACL
jgi:pyrroloquinoline-quinone synthase